MKAFKGFNRDMTCRGFPYKEGQKYETDSVELCECGFHACEHPLDCLGYYPPNSSVYHEVELSGEIDQAPDNTKVAATKIKIGARLSIAELVTAAIDFVKAKAKSKAAEERRMTSSATGNRGVSSATSYCGISSATGAYGASSATGDYGVSSATGDYGTSSATGDYSASSVSGERGISSVTGDGGVSSAENPTAIAVAWGIHGRARGVKGAHIVLADWRRGNGEWILHGAKMVKIDGKRYKADTWYTIEDGKVVEDEVEAK